MKRSCTEAENGVIKASAEDILSRIETYDAVAYSGSLPVNAAAWMRRAFHGEETRKKQLPGAKFQVNGGTFLRIAYSKAGVQLIFAEDDVTDDRGKPCCIAMPGIPSAHLSYGERLLLVYSDSGAYIPLRVTERTKSLLPECAPEYFESVDWEEAVCFPHPAARVLERKSTQMQIYEREEFVRTWKCLKYARAKNALGIFLFGFFALFLLALLFVGLVAGDVITEFYEAMAFVVAAVDLWLFLTCKFAKRILTDRMNELKNVKYKKKVLFHSIGRAPDENNTARKYLSVYEYLNGSVKLVSYPVNGSDFLPGELYYGKVLWKYSQEEKSCTADKNYFGICKINV